MLFSVSFVFFQQFKFSRLIFLYLIDDFFLFPRLWQYQQYKNLLN